MSSAPDTPASRFPDPLVVMALPMESQGLFEQAGVPVLYTGVGKVNATYALMKRLAEYRHAARPAPRVINFGTVGSRRFPTGTLMGCHAFVQRDMDVTGLGFARGETPYDESTPLCLEHPVFFTQLPSGVCGTGDSFETRECPVACDVLDMEAYALAKVCWLEGVPFACAKYVTDGADESSSKDWHANLVAGAEAFLRLYRSITGQAATP